MLTCGTPWPHTNSAPDGDPLVTVFTVLPALVIILVGVL